MGFKEARRWLIAALLEGRYQHETRADQDIKNVLASGQVSADFIISLLKICRGDQHSCSAHHQDDALDTHVFKPEFGGQKWYIKVHQLEPDAVFISVHLSEHGG